MRLVAPVPVAPRSQASTAPRAAVPMQTATAPPRAVDRISAAHRGDRLGAILARSCLSRTPRDRVQLLQRYGAAGPGVPGKLTITRDDYLVHGTGVAQFRHRRDWRSQIDPHAPLGRVGVAAAPDPPAWFAKGSAFSVHAGGRTGAASVSLHNYRVKSDIWLLAFDDFDDLAAFLLLNGKGRPADHNEERCANAVLALQPGSDGYCLMRDMVRGEPEYILFARGIDKLERAFKAELVTEIVPTGDVTLPISGDLAAIEEKRVYKDPSGLAVHESRGGLHFETIANKGSTRPRSGTK